MTLLQSIIVRFLTAILAVAILWSCDEEVEINITGNVFLDGVPIVDAHIKLDDDEIIATTDSEGFFQINSLTPGTHLLQVVKYVNDQAYSQKNYLLDVSGDLSLSRLIIPAPIRITGSSATSTSSAIVQWSKSLDPDFLHYSVYRASFSPFTDVNAELVYTTTSRDDVEFIDENWSPSGPFYYRVYAYDALGKIGGSEITRIEDYIPPVVEFIRNGSFEEMAVSKPQHWATSTNVSVSSDAYDGKVSVLIQSPNGQSKEIAHQIEGALLTVAANYSIDFFYKSATPLKFKLVLDKRVGITETPIDRKSIDLGPTAGTWHRCSIDVSIPAMLSTEDLRCAFEFYDSTSVYVNVDMVTMVVKQ